MWRNTQGCASHFANRLYGTDVKLAGEENFIRHDIQFRLGRHTTLMSDLQAHEGAPYMEMEFLGDHIPVEQIRDLLAMLFEHKVLFLEADL